MRRRLLSLALANMGRVMCLCYWKAQWNLTPSKWKIPQPINTKFSHNWSHRPGSQMCHRRLCGGAPICAWNTTSVWLFKICLVSWFLRHTSRSNGYRRKTYEGSNDAMSANTCLVGVSLICNTIMGLNIIKPENFIRGEISSLIGNIEPVNGKRQMISTDTYTKEAVAKPNSDFTSGSGTSSCGRNHFRPCFSKVKICKNPQTVRSEWWKFTEHWSETEAMHHIDCML